MALAPDSDITMRITNAGRAAMPIVYKADLDEHRRDPRVQTRLQRVKALIEMRAQQNV